MRGNEGTGEYDKDIFDIITIKSSPMNDDSYNIEAESLHVYSLQSIN